MPYRLEDARKRTPELLARIAQARTPMEAIRVVVTFFVHGLSPDKGDVYKDTGMTQSNNTIQYGSSDGKKKQ